MKDFVACGLDVFGAGVSISDGTRPWGSGPLPTGGARGIARSATPGSAS